LSLSNIIITYPEALDAGCMLTAVDVNLRINQLTISKRFQNWRLYAYGIRL